MNSTLARRLPVRFDSSAALETLAARLDHLETQFANTPRLHRKEVMQRYALGSASTLHRWLRAGKLPQPVRLGGPLWRLADLEAAENAGQLPQPVTDGQSSAVRLKQGSVRDMLRGWRALPP